MIYLYNEILLGHKKGMWYWYIRHMDESWKHCAAWKKPITKDHILCDSTCMKVQNREIYGDKMLISGYLGYRGKTFAGVDEW